MASDGFQPSPPPGQRHSGVVHGGIRQRPVARPRRDWIGGGIVAGLTLAMLVVVANAFAGKPPTVATVDSPSPSATVISSLPIFIQETPELTPSPTPFSLPTVYWTPTPYWSPTPSPTPWWTPTPTPTPTPPPTPTPTVAITPTPTPTLSAAPSAGPASTPTTSPGRGPKPTPTPVATPQPSAPTYGLIILAPAEDAAVDTNSVVISGLTQPGATVTRDVPMWFDEHTVADSSGHWSFTESLNIGENSFLFRVGDDRATEVTLTVYFSP